MRHSLGEGKELNAFTQGFVVGACCLSDAVVVTHGCEGEREEKNQLFYMVCAEAATGAEGEQGAFLVRLKEPLISALRSSRRSF